jgi:ABC-2 type transport system permease protein/sodium transport system permease protein
MAKLSREKFVVAVPDDRTADELREIIETVQKDDEAVEAENLDTGTEAPAATQAKEKGASFTIQVKDPSSVQLGEAVHLLVALDQQPVSAPAGQTYQRLKARIKYTEVSIRSETSMRNFVDLLQQYQRIISQHRLELYLTQQDQASAGGSEAFLDPVHISTESVATQRQRGGWIMGQVVPVILVMMIITGAIYPAIDLTAGERERGTLESLMTTPVSVMQLVTGKFLVVATIAMITAVLNVSSIGATMYFGGMAQLMASELPVELPFSALPLILVCMIPFAFLFAAILIAVCSFARSFKEAQNYVMPVIVCSLIPAFAVVIPTIQLEGIMLVIPVGNMVLLTRELFQGSYEWGSMAAVLLSTSLYAAAAIAIAARLFGKEAVLFSDAGSYRAMFDRRYFQRTIRPNASQALLLAAVLFPVSFYAQSILFDFTGQTFFEDLISLAFVQFAGLFIALPLAVVIFLKINAMETFGLRLPPLRSWFAAICMGLSSWILAHEFFLIQSRLFPPSEASMEFFRQLGEQFATMPVWAAFVLLGLAPAIGEEFFFRGFLLSGLKGKLGKWSTLFVAALIFGVFHFVIDKVPVTTLLGMALGYLCWQSRSIWPCIVFHALHNGSAIILPTLPNIGNWLNAGAVNRGGHFPLAVIVGAATLFVFGIVLIGTIQPGADASQKHEHIE